MKIFLSCFFGVGLGVVAVNLAMPMIIPAKEPDKSLMSLRVPDDYQPCKDAPDVIRRMSFSLDTEPSAWSTDGYRAQRAGGGAMWVSNRAYGLEVGPDKSRLRSIDDKSAKECLWNAYQRWALNPANFR